MLDILQCNVMLPKHGPGKHPPPPSVFMINNSKDQCFYEMIGSANKSDNNTLYYKKKKEKKMLTVEIDSYCSILYSGKETSSSVAVTKEQFGGYKT